MQAASTSASAMEIVSLIGSAVSTALAVLAIWQSMHFKKEADAVNRDTLKLLMEVRVETAVTKTMIASEMAKSGDVVRRLALGGGFTTSTGGLNTTAAGDLASSVVPSPATSPQSEAGGDDASQ